MLRLQDYDYQVIYRPGKTNIADAQSRLNRNSQDTSGDQVGYVRFVEAITTKMVESALVEGPELQNVCQCIQSGQWDNCQNKTYIAVGAELCTIGQLVLHGNRIIIPEKPKPKVVALAHEGHFGIVGTKQRLRSKVWWQKMKRDAERHCRTCHGCQLVNRQNPPEPLDKLCFSASHLIRYWKMYNYMHMQCLCILCIFWEIKHLNLNLSRLGVQRCYRARGRAWLWTSLVHCHPVIQC